MSPPYGMTCHMHILLFDCLRVLMISTNSIHVHKGFIKTSCNEFTMCIVFFRIYEGAPYNLPDETSLQAGKDILQLAKNATEDDLIISLVSGGGSALMSLPLDGVSLQEKTEVMCVHV